MAIEKHVHGVRRETERDRFHDLIDGLTTRKGTTLAIITILHKQAGRGEFPIGRIYTAHTNLRQMIGIESRTERWVRDFTRNSAFFDAFDARERNQGRAGGITVYASPQFVYGLKIVHEIVVTDDRFADVDDSETTAPKQQPIHLSFPMFIPAVVGSFHRR